MLNFGGEQQPAGVPPAHPPHPRPSTTVTFTRGGGKVWSGGLYDHSEDKKRERERE